MSAGPFLSVFYESDDGSIWRARAQPETLALAINSAPNASPAGPATEGRIKLTRSNREIGIKPRRVGFQFDPGETPTGYSTGETYYLPIFQFAFFAGISPGNAATYLGGAGTIVSTFGERDS